MAKALKLDLTSLRFEQQTVNDDLAEFLRIYIRNTMQWLGMDERKAKNVGKRAKTVGALMHISKGNFFTLI